MAARTIPIRTVQPIRVPWVRQAQRTEGCRKRGKGRRKRWRKESCVLRPEKGDRVER